jgi:hypothetical protein
MMRLCIFLGVVAGVWISREAQAQVVEPQSLPKVAAAVNGMTNDGSMFLMQRVEPGHGGPGMRSRIFNGAGTRSWGPWSTTQTEFHDSHDNPNGTAIAAIGYATTQPRFNGFYDAEDSNFNDLTEAPFWVQSTFQGFGVFYGPDVQGGLDPNSPWGPDFVPLSTVVFPGTPSTTQLVVVGLSHHPNVSGTIENGRELVWNGSSWSMFDILWPSAAGGGLVDSFTLGPRAAAAYNGRTLVFVGDQDGNLYYYEPLQSKGWTPLGFVGGGNKPDIVGTPVAVPYTVNGVAVLAVFVTARINGTWSLFHRFADGTTWEGWVNDGTPPSGNPFLLDMVTSTVFTSGTGLHINLFGNAMDTTGASKLVNFFWDPGNGHWAWGDTVAGPTGSFTTMSAASIDAPAGWHQVSVFGMDANNKVIERVFDTDSSNGWVFNMLDP